MATDKKISELTAATSALSTDIIPVARSGANFSLTVAQVIAGTVPNSRQITTTSPLLGGGALTSNLSLTIQQASSTQSGYLSNGDWSLFNNKFNTPTGTTSQYIRGDGSLATLPTTATNFTTAVRNQSGTVMHKGTVIYISGSTGNLPLITRAVGTSDATSAGTFGIVLDDINNNADGTVVNLGSIDTLDTRTTATYPFTDVTLADGDTVYLHPTIPGYITNVKPSAPYHLVYIGKVIRTSPTNGTIVYKIQNGYELDEIHDVSLPSYVSNGVLYRDTVNNLWKNAAISTVLGYTPEDSNNKSTNTSLGTSNILYPTQNAVKVYTDNLLGNANALVYKGVIDCSANPNYPAANAGELYITSVAGKIGGTSGIDVEVGDMIICNTDNSVSGNQATVGTNWNIIQKNIVGAVTGPASSINNNVAFFDGTTGKLIKDSGLTLSGVNTGDETQATIQTKLGLASATTSGYLSSSNWNDFNNKIGGSGSTNYVARFTASGTIGSGITQDDGTTVGIGTGATSNTRLSISGSTQTYGLQVSGGLTAAITASGPGIGLSASSSGSLISSCGISATHTTNATAIAGKFVASGTGTKYSLQLSDGSEGSGRFLKDVTGTGNANWANIGVADVSGAQPTITLSTNFTSGPATLVGNTLNIPQYSGGASVVGSADYLYLYNNFK